MKWLVYSYSLPSKFSTNSRVRLWRKLRKLGAVSPKSGMYILPYNEESVNALRWITAEVEQEQGEALMMKVDQFENLSDDNIIDIFRKERSKDYLEIEAFLKNLETTVQPNPDIDQVAVLQKNIKTLRKNLEEVSKVDFFKACDKNKLMDRLLELQRSLLTGNLILMIMFSVGTLNNIVLRKMKEEYTHIPRKVMVEIKPVPGNGLHSSD